ncbi:MAG: peptide deformylase [Bacilli bacterium]|nr:peptide deformylase [Bacilli bacterium]
MLRTKDIIDEKNKILRKKSLEVSFPMSDEDKENIRLMVEYLTNSQIDELASKYGLRPGMGMSAVQIGVLKRYITIVHEKEEGKFDTYVVVNPKIVSESKEKIYVEDGEGCLSINRETIGIVPRSARVTVEGFDVNGNPISIRAREELAIVFQHEIDHLDGILFIDRIDPKNPFKGKDTYRAI